MKWDKVDKPAYFVTSSNPWFLRSGAYNDTTGAGVLAYSRNNGNWNDNFSFRAVLDYDARKLKFSNKEKEKAS